MPLWLISLFRRRLIQLIHIIISLRHSFISPLFSSSADIFAFHMLALPPILFGFSYWLAFIFADIFIFAAIILSFRHSFSFLHYYTAFITATHMLIFRLAFARGLRHFRFFSRQPIGRRHYTSRIAY